MRDDIKHLECKIKFIEDLLLRTKNRYEQEKYSSKLMTLRRSLQQLQWEESK